VQTTEFCLGEGALLEYLPDPVIPFRGATYTQRSRMVLGRGATLLAWDLFTPGREASGECFAFTHLANALRIETAEGPLAVEDWALTPDAGGIETAARLGPFTSHASFYICQADPAARWRELLQQLQAISSEQSQPPEVTWGVSLLARDGLVVRGASRNSRLLATGLLPFWQCAKLALTGRPASAPRKVR
jgi:urease accessory protein